MPNRKIICLIFLLSISFFAAGQNTIGTILNDEGSLNGLTFFSPFSGTKAYLVDNCGRLINHWDRGNRPGLSAYFLESGLMFRTYKPSPKGPFTSASNAGGLELVDWENNTVWKYEINTDTQLSHHDAVVLPNGNILVLTWQLAYEDELIELGRDPDQIDPAGFAWSEKIIEIEPIGSSDAIIIWEWQIKDHYIQSFDSTKLGFGVVSEHPELFNINLPDLNSSNSHSNFDWNHFNSIDYDPTFDQILISVRNSDEIWVLDHSTTTEEAATHSGGQSGKGGDMLYRWGNPAAYERGTINDQKLFGQHGVNWVPQGHTSAGRILIFNNGNGRPGTDFSTAEYLLPARDEDGRFEMPEQEAFGPETLDRIIGDETGSRRYSAFLSNAQSLPNENTLINYGSLGTIVEVNKFDEVVWEYVIPLNGDAPLNQGQNASGNWTFRAYKYSLDYAGFEGVDLTPGAPIESGTDLSDCQISSLTDQIKFLDQLEFQWFPAEHQFEINVPVPVRLNISIVDITGRILIYNTLNSYPYRSKMLSLTTGIYFLRIAHPNGEVITHKIFNP